MESPASGGIIEVTDGWYSVNAHLDDTLTQHMALGKIYPGLKLRVLGARVPLSCHALRSQIAPILLNFFPLFFLAKLSGSDNAVSPLEADGTYYLFLPCLQLLHLSLTQIQPHCYCNQTLSGELSGIASLVFKNSSACIACLC